MTRSLQAGVAAFLLSVSVGTGCHLQIPPPSPPGTAPRGSVAPDVDLGTSTPEPTVEFSPSGGTAPDADTTMPTPEPTLQPYGN